MAASPLAPTVSPVYSAARLIGGGAHLRVAAMPTESEVLSARRRLHAKALGVVLTVVGSYSVLLAAQTPWYVRIASFPVLLVSLIMVATSVMHDANHRAFFAGSPRANHLVGYISDLLGVSSALWRIKHNIHHASPNVQGVDPDIDQGIVARLAPTQHRHWWHRAQHQYLWPLYGLLGVQWLLVSDFTDLARGRIGDQTLSHLSHVSRASIFFGKLLHVSWALVLPMIWYPWWAVIAVYLVSSWTVGIVLAVTFQIAHCVDEAEFVLPDAARKGDDFVLHQLATTVNITRRATIAGRFRSLVLGGLDHQIEHHLAPEVPHTAYAAMSVRLERACREAGAVYKRHANVANAIRSHHRWLRTMATTPSPLRHTD